MQQYRTINTKIKESYFESSPINEEVSVLKSRYTTWGMLNHIAISNMVIQNLPIPH